MNFLIRLFLYVFISCYSIMNLCSDAENKKAKDLNIAQQAAVGAGMGIMDAVVSTPLTSIKNRVQAGQPLSRNPRDYFRGFSLFAATLTPIAQTQNVSFETLKTHYGVSSSVAAPAAGAIAAVIVNPIDLALRHIQTDHEENPNRTAKKAETTNSGAGQSRKKVSGSQTMRQLYARNGIQCLSRGLLVTMFRDSFYAASYLEGMSSARKAIAQQTNEKKIQHFGALGAGLVIGTATTVLTQPLDTIQGAMQRGEFPGSLGYRSARQAIRMVPQVIDPKTKQKIGAKAFFAGTTSRLGLVSASILVLDGAKETLTAYAGRAH